MSGQRPGEGPEQLPRDASNDLSDRYQFHDLLRAYATDQAHHDEPPDRRETALRRVLDWYLHTADAAQSWIEPAEDHVSVATS